MGNFARKQIVQEIGYLYNYALNMWMPVVSDVYITNILFAYLGIHGRKKHFQGGRVRTSENAVLHKCNETRTKIVKIIFFPRSIEITSKFATIWRVYKKKAWLVVRTVSFVVLYLPYILLPNSVVTVMTYSHSTKVAMKTSPLALSQ